MTYSTCFEHSVISTHNRQRLGTTIDEARRCGMVSPDLLMCLEEKLELAECVSPPEIPDSVVTMNSRFRLRDSVTGEVKSFVLCYPESAGATSEDLSVLDPIGCAVLGCRLGDEIVAEEASGMRRLQLVEVLY
jgi:regulator of nucleoside diphosphate kinase